MDLSEILSYLPTGAQTEIATRANVSKTTISNIFNGVTKPNLATMKIIMDYVNEYISIMESIQRVTTLPKVQSKSKVAV